MLFWVEKYTRPLIVALINSQQRVFLQIKGKCGVQTRMSLNWIKYTAANYTGVLHEFKNSIDNWLTYCYQDYDWFKGTLWI